jgi:hypothetical protein
MYNGDTVAPNTGSGTSIGTNTEDTRLGLVYNVGKMYLKKSVVNTLVGVAMPATKNYSDFSDTIKKIKADLKKLESIDILKSDPYKAECSPIINEIYFDIGTIQKAVSDLGNFMDNPQRNQGHIIAY